MDMQAHSDSIEFICAIQKKTLIYVCRPMYVCMPPNRGLRCENGNGLLVTEGLGSGVSAGREMPPPEFGLVPNLPLTFHTLGL